MSSDPNEQLAGAGPVERLVRPRRMVGRCSTGNQLGGGVKWHAVPMGAGDWGLALCGMKPGRLSGGWSEAGQEITCPKCWKKLS